MDTVVQKIKTVLKLQLKKKGLTYEMLADELNVSLPTIKRWLGDGDLGLNELSDIAKVLGLSMLDVHLLAEKLEKKNDYTFTKEQDEFLAKNTGYFSYLLRLYEGLTPIQIAEKYGLSKLSTDKYLIKLEQLGLIRVSGKQKVSPVFDVVPNTGSGELTKTYFRAFIASAGDFFSSIIEAAVVLRKTPAETKTNAFESIATYGMIQIKISEESYKKWHNSQAKAFSELEALAKLEEKALDESKLYTAVCLNAHCLLPNKHPELSKIENIFGEIKNL